MHETMMNIHSIRQLASYAFALVALTFVFGLSQFAQGAPLTRAAFLTVAAPAQQSLLDLPDEEEEPPLQPKPGGGAKPTPAASKAETTSAPNSSGGLDVEEAPLDAPAASPRSPGLDDPAADDDDDDETDPTAEPVCDILFATTSERGDKRKAWPIKLLVKWMEFPLPRTQLYEFEVRNTNGQGYSKLHTRGDLVSGVQYYEQRMLAKAAAEFFVSPEELARPNAVFDPADATRASKAARVEAILKEALAQHDSAIQRFARRGELWGPKLRAPLAQALLNLQALQIRLMVKQGRQEEATAACDRLRQQLQVGAMGQVELKTLYETVLIEPAIDAGRRGDFAAVRALLAEYNQRFPLDSGGRAEQVRGALIRRAQALADRAATEAEQRERLNLLEQAAAIWPHLHGLDTQMRSIQIEYPVLECAYATLPRNLSPLSMSTPVDRHAAALLFEGLVHWTEQSRAGPHYASQLALARPVPLPRGRQFRLPACGWSDSQPNGAHLCTAEDVRWTIRLLKNVHPAGFPPAWDRLIQGADAAGNDPFTVNVHLQVDHWQPLSLMDFLVLPKSCFPTCGEDPSELEAFNEAPVGVGPYRLLDRDPNRVRFQANPVYRKPELPRIREISFNRLEPTDAVDQFLQGKIHLIFGVRREHVDQLERQGKKVVALPARSVYFLAPNYRRESILRSREVRLAIAHVINRKQILDQFFRPGQHPNRHAELTGPYPTSSWAYNAQAPKFDPSQAKVLLQSQGQLASARPLVLVYPARDAETEQACQEIAKQVRTLGIQITLESVEPDLFRGRVVQHHAFDLAYWRHDFEDETYWIWPLFDPGDTQPGGSNFMGFTPSEDLRTTFDDLLKHKEFSRIRELARRTHLQINRDAAIIPLWQLETHVAVSPALRDAAFDPICLFENVEQWSLAPARKARP